MTRIPVCLCLMSDLHTTLLYQLETAVRGTGQEAAGQVSRGHLPFIDRAETVHVLGRVHSVSDQVRVDLGGGVQRHLDNDPVHSLVLVQLLDLGQELGLGRRAGQFKTGGLDPNQLGSFQLHSDVDIAVFSSSNLTQHSSTLRISQQLSRIENFSTNYLNNDKTRLESRVVVLQFFHLLLEVILDLGRQVSSREDDANHLASEETRVK